MKRVFQVSEITQLCKDIKSILEQCKEHVSAMRTYADQAGEALDAVPYEVRYGIAVHDVSQLRSALKTEQMETALTKLEKCRQRACDLIPAADTDYASQTRELAGVTKSLQTLLEEMEQFLIDTPLTTDYSAFKKAFEEVQARWNKVTENGEKAVEKLMANIKGAEAICHAFSKDPVNLSTGNFIYDRTDLEVGGRESFAFRRFYNAINAHRGVLGKDWNHNYEVHLELTDGEAVLLREDGKEERFFWEKDRYLSLFASEGALEKEKNGYTYRTRAQKTYRFDKEGKCLETESLTGSRITFAYEEEAPFRLVKVKKETGEFFVFFYDTEGMLERVEDHTGRGVAYRYQGELLKEATLPDGNAFRYGYTSQGKLEQVENPRGIVTVENFFDEENRTTLQKFPDGTQMSYTYDEEKKTVELTERNGSRVVYVHDDKYRDIKHIHSNGEERFAYNQNNQKTLYVDRLGNKTQYAYDPAGNLVRVIDALGNKTEIRYGEKNEPTGIRINGKEKLCGEYDAQGRLVKTKDALGNETGIRYNEAGRPEEIRQADGSLVRLSYDDRGNITELRDAQGNRTCYAYDDLNRMTESIDGKGNVTRYTYDIMGNVTRIENAEGNSQSYEYNASGKVTKVTDFDGESIQREYNVLNRPSKAIDKEGRETLLTYDSMWNLARVTAPDRGQTTYIYNEHNLLSRVKHADGSKVRYTYDANGNRTGEEDENGAKTRFTYDALGRVVEVNGEEGLHYAYRYDGEGNLIHAEDALGNTVSMEYDANGNLVKETSPLGESRSYTYTPLGDVESITDEAGRRIRYSYHPGGQLKAICYPDGREEAFAYDANGNLESHTLATGFTLTYTYDSMDRITEIRGSEGERKTYTYDALGNVTSMTDGKGHTTRYAYTLSGQLLKVTDALGNETRYRYDACDRLTEIRQYGAEGSLKGDTEVSGMDEALLEAEKKNGRNRVCHITRYTRDLRGQVTEVTDALGQKEAYTYDPKGQLLGKLDKDGYLTKYAYTKQGDVSRIQYADGREVKLSYNPLRQLIEVQDWLGLTRIQNDALGRATKVTYPDQKEVSYTYGKAGERRSITYPDGRTVYYGYDEQLRLSELKEGDRVITYGYDEQGRLKNKQFPNGTSTTWKYDEKSQLTELIHRDKEGILDRYTYTYDLVGNKTGIRKERRGLTKESGTYTYGYDALDRLESIRKDNVLETQYRYDAFGNRIKKESEEHQTSYWYNSLNQLINLTDQSQEGTSRETYLYDRRGNLSQVIRDGTVKNRYVYGALNRLEEAVNVAGETAKYQYHGLGHRVGKEISLDPTKQLSGQSQKPDSRIDYLIDLTREYHNLLEKTEDGISQTYFWDGNVAAFEESGKRSYYLQDELGSPLRIEDESGLTRETYGYGAFGEDLYGNQGVLQVFGYTGYQRDSIAGTYYAQAREYQAEVGRFVSEDFVGGVTGHPYSINRYQYCAENPLAYIDLNGKFLITAILATAAIGAGVGAGINLISQGINIARGKQKKFNVGSFFGSAIEGGIVAGVSAIPGVGTVAVGLSAGVGGGINSVLKQYGESGEIDIGQVAEDAMVSGVVGGIAYKFTSIRNAKAGKTPTAQEISANAKTRDARKKVLDEIKASGKTPSGLRRRVDSSYALKHKELLKKYAQSSIVGNSKELLANQLEYETDIYVIKGHANIKGYIKDMLKDFLPIENSDDWIMSILSNNIKVDKDGEETLEICGVMG